MKTEIDNATTLLRQMLLERGITEYPTLNRATKHEAYNANGEVSEVWYDIEYRRIHAPLETFTQQAYTSKHSVTEYEGSGFMNTECADVRFGVETVYNLLESDKQALRDIGKLQTISEPATEYEALVC